MAASVAQCPATVLGGAYVPEAYGGGVNVTTTGPNQNSDVVSATNSFLGYLSGGVPTPGGSPNGNATLYEAQGDITLLNAGDGATVQAYVVCGP